MENFCTALKSEPEDAGIWSGKITEPELVDFAYANWGTKKIRIDSEVVARVVVDLHTHEPSYVIHAPNLVNEVYDKILTKKQAFDKARSNGTLHLWKNTITQVQQEVLRAQTAHQDRNRRGGRPRDRRKRRRRDDQWPGNKGGGRPGPKPMNNREGQKLGPRSQRMQGRKQGANNQTNHQNGPKPAQPTPTVGLNTNKKNENKNQKAPQKGNTPGGKNQYTSVKQALASATAASNTNTANPALGTQQKLQLPNVPPGVKPSVVEALLKSGVGSQLLAMYQHSVKQASLAQQQSSLAQQPLVGPQPNAADNFNQSQDMEIDEQGQSLHGKHPNAPYSYPQTQEAQRHANQQGALAYSQGVGHGGYGQSTTDGLYQAYATNQGTAESQSQQSYARGPQPPPPPDNQRTTGAVFKAYATAQAKDQNTGNKQSTAQHGTETTHTNQTYSQTGQLNATSAAYQQQQQAAAQNAQTQAAYAQAMMAASAGQQAAGMSDQNAYNMQAYNQYYGNYMQSYSQPQTQAANPAAYAQALLTAQAANNPAFPQLPAALTKQPTFQSLPGTLPGVTGNLAGQLDSNRLLLVLSQMMQK